MMSSGEANLKSCKMDTDPGGSSFCFSSSFSSTSPEMEVTEIILAKEILNALSAVESKSWVSFYVIDS
jgi:hypothetical protein